MNIVIQGQAVMITEKEQYIVQALANGKRLKDVASEYGKSVRTFESTMMKLRKKFNCATQTELAAKFLREKIIE